MNTFQDMTGMRFGILTVLQRVPNLPNSRVTRWRCKCECGNIVDVNRNNLLHRHSLSCGCLARENKIKRFKKYNSYICVGYTENTKQPFIIDCEDYEKIKEYCWSENRDGYIISRDSKSGKNIFLHRRIIKSDRIIDHINRNKKDNRKANLRIVTPQQNCMNKGIQRNNKSGVSGVYYDKSRERWVAQLTLNGKKHFKRFRTKTEAIVCRKNYEEKYFKEYAPKAEIDSLLESWGKK